MLADSDGEAPSEEPSAAQPGAASRGATSSLGVACVPPTPAALDALRSPSRALPPAKRSRGTAAADVAGVGAARGAPAPWNTLWHFLNQQSAAALPPSTPTRR